MLSFQQIILRLQDYWDRQGCALLQPYDMEVGAGTSHTATFLRALGPEPWKAAYVQPSRRPKDGRYGDNPNRLQHYYQFQVVLKPAPDNILERSEEHTSELQSRLHLVCRLLLEKKNQKSVEVLTGAACPTLRSAAREVMLSTATSVAFDPLVLATGSPRLRLRNAAGRPTSGRLA